MSKLTRKPNRFKQLPTNMLVNGSTIIYIINTLIQKAQIMKNYQRKHWQWRATATTTKHKMWYCLNNWVNNEIKEWAVHKNAINTIWFQWFADTFAVWPTTFTNLQSIAFLRFSAFQPEIGQNCDSFHILLYHSRFIRNFFLMCIDWITLYGINIICRPWWRKFISI